MAYRAIVSLSVPMTIGGIVVSINGYRLQGENPYLSCFLFLFFFLLRGKVWQTLIILVELVLWSPGGVN